MKQKSWLLLIGLVLSFSIQAQFYNAKGYRIVPRTLTADSVGISGISEMQYDGGSDEIRFWNGTSWFSYVKDLSVGTAGTNVNWTNPSVGRFNLNIPDASASARGVITTGAQTFAGDKTFTGKIGIGGSPTYNLDIQTSANSQLRLTTSSSANQPELILSRTAGTTTAWSIYSPSGSEDLRFYNSSDRVTLTTDGDVRWSGRNNGHARSLKIGYSGGDYGGVGYNIGFDTGASGSWVYELADKASLLVFHNGGFLFKGTSTTGGIGNPISFTNFLEITNAGNVGIGMTPTTKLDVKSTGVAQGISLTHSSTSDYLVGISQGAGNHGLIQLWDNSASLRTQIGAGSIDTYFLDGEFGLGTSSIDRKFHVEADNAATNTVTQITRLTSTSSGTPAAGIGTGLEFETETAAANNEVGITLEAITTDVTSTSEDFDFVVKNMAAGAAAAETFRVTSTGVIKPSGGVNPDSGGIKHKRVDIDVDALSEELVTVTWGTAFANTNYTVVATMHENNTATELGLYVVKVEDKLAGSVTVWVRNSQNSGLNGTLQVIAVHD